MKFFFFNLSCRKVCRTMDKDTTGNKTPRSGEERTDLNKKSKSKKRFT